MATRGFILAGLHLEVAGHRFALATPAVKYNLALAVFSACFLLSLWLTRSPAGRVLVAVRENEERTTARVQHLGLPALLRDAVGPARGRGGLDLHAALLVRGLELRRHPLLDLPLLWTLLGGAGTVLGPLVGTLVMTYVVDVTSGFTTAYLLVVGVALIGMILWAPASIVGGVRSRWAASS